MKSALKDHGKVRPVCVEWVDSMGKSGWGDLDKPSDTRCISVGILVARTKDRIHLSLNRSVYSHGEHIEIPMSAVRRVHHLSFKEEKRKGYKRTGYKRGR